MLDEITQALTEKGWKSVDANPDALVLLHGATEKQKSLNTFYSGGGYGGYGYRGLGGMGGMGTATTTTSEYMVGTLVVDIFDAKTKALMFRGTATDELSDKPEKNAEEAAEGVRQDVQGLPAGLQGEEVARGERRPADYERDFGARRWPSGHAPGRRSHRGAAHARPGGDRDLRVEAR